MNNIWKAAIVLTAAIVTAHSLTCNTCPIGIFGGCLFGSTVSCDNATSRCFTGQAQFNATGSFSLMTRGCIDSDLCERTLTGTILGAGYTSSFTCCNTDCCNGATSIQISLTAALAAATLSSLWGFGEF